MATKSPCAWKRFPAGSSSAARQSLSRRDRNARTLEPASASAAKPAAGRAPAAKARTAAAARRRSHHRTRAHGHVVQAVHEHNRIEAAIVVAALIPGGRLRVDILKRADQFFLDTQRHRVR